MSSKLQATRSIAAELARRSVKFATIVSIGVTLLLLITTWALSTYIDPWWWLLLLIIVPLILLCVAILTLATFVVRTLTPTQLSKQQRRATKAYVDKLQRLAETRGMGWPMFAYLSIKDIVIHRDLRTAKSVLSDTTSLASDFQRLVKLFG